MTNNRKQQILAIALVAVMIAGAGCTGWGGDGPAENDDGNDSPSELDETNQSETENGSDSDDDTSSGSDGATDDESDSSSGSSDSGTSDGDSSDSSDCSTGDCPDQSDDTEDSAGGSQDSDSGGSDGGDAAPDDTSGQDTDDSSDSSDDSDSSDSSDSDDSTSGGDDSSDGSDGSDGDDGDSGDDTDAVAADLTVTVEDQDGNAVEGVEVVGIGPDAEIYSATTNADGQASYSDLPAGDYEYHVTTDGTDYEESSTEQITLEDGDEKTLTVTVTDSDAGTEPGASLTVTVEDQDGNAVEGIEVVGIGPDAEIYSTTTNADGQATYDGLPAGDYEFRATTSDEYPESSTEEISLADGDDESLTVTVQSSSNGDEPETSTLTVTVDNHNSNPVENASVSVVTDGGGDEVASGTTDANGQATFDLANGEYDVIVNHEDVQGDAATPVTVDGDTEASLTLDTSEGLATGIVNVVDQNGDPVEGEEVELWAPDVVDESEAETRTTDENGQVVIELAAGDPSDVVMFDVIVRGQEQQLGIMADAYQGVQEVTFEVDTSGEQRTCDTFDSHDEAQSYYEEAPEERGHLDGDDDGTACEALQGNEEPDVYDFLVTVQESEESYPIEGVDVTLVNEDGVEVGTQTTNEDGEVVFEDLVPGDYTISISGYGEEFEDPGEATVTVPDEENYVFSLVEDSPDEPETANASAVVLESVKHQGAEPVTESDELTLRNSDEQLPLDISGWEIDFGADQPVVTISEDVTISPGETLTITLDQADKVLNPSGGTMVIYDAEGEEVNTFSYIGSPSAPGISNPDDPANNESGNATATAV